MREVVVGSRTENRRRLVLALLIWLMLALPGLVLASHYHVQHYTELEGVPGSTVYAGHDWDDVVPHLWGFFEAVRSREPVVQDAVFGNHAAIACHMANESFFRESLVRWDDRARAMGS